MSDERNFKEWYVDVLEALYPRREAGIAAFMIALPLLERYVRQVSCAGPDDTIDKCYAAIRTIFPVLQSDKAAGDFWKAYRHGFLHQATMSKVAHGGRALPAAELTHDITVAVHIKTDGSFTVNPEKFARQVVSVIQADFATFIGKGSSAPPLPQVYPIPGTGMLGTGTPPINTTK